MGIAGISYNSDRQSNERDHQQHPAPVNYCGYARECACLGLCADSTILVLWCTGKQDIPRYKMRATAPLIEAPSMAAKREKREQEVT